MTVVVMPFWSCYVQQVFLLLRFQDRQFLQVSVQGGLLEDQPIASHKNFRFIKELFNEVFPDAFERYLTDSEAARERRMYSAEHFDSYFEYTESPASKVLEIVDDLVADKEGVRNRAVQKLTRLALTNERIIRLFNGLSEQQALDWRQISEPLLIKLGQIFDKPLGDRANPLPAERVLNLAKQWLDKIPNTERRIEAAIELCSKWSENGCQFLCILLADELLNPTNKKTPFRPALLPSHRGEVNDIVNGWGKNWALVDTNLLNHSHAKSILELWQAIDATAANTLISRNMKDDFGFFQFLNAFLIEDVRLRNGQVIRTPRLAVDSLIKLLNKPIEPLLADAKAIGRKRPAISSKFPKVLRAIERAEDNFVSTESALEVHEGSNEEPSITGM
jgi:hypothetical protein